jgi:hypothetical protein
LDRAADDDAIEPLDVLRHRAVEKLACSGTTNPDQPATPS